MQSKADNISANSYRGLKMRCAPGTHEAAMSLLLSENLPRSLKVLDIASGSGAFLARLADAGFLNLSAIELDRPKFGFEGCEPIGVDLNTPFHSQLANDFDLITAIEIIEHLDSPRGFLHEAYQLLAENGMLLLTTPNVTNWRGRLKFLLTGDLRYFDRGQYQFNHHISPITDTQMRLMLQEVGFELMTHVTAGRFKTSIGTRWVDWIAKLVGGASAVGEVRFYLCSKGTPKNVRPGDWSTAMCES